MSVRFQRSRQLAKRKSNVEPVKVKAEPVEVKTEPSQEIVSKTVEKEDNLQRQDSLKSLVRLFNRDSSLSSFRLDSCRLWVLRNQFPAQSPRLI